jgi:hypothetical protein
VQAEIQQRLLAESRELRLLVDLGRHATKRLTRRASPSSPPRLALVAFGGKKPVDINPASVATAFWFDF